jgi:hypothetical protein
VEKRVKDKNKMMRNKCIEVQAVPEMDSLFTNKKSIITRNGILLL